MEQSDSAVASAQQTEKKNTRLVNGLWLLIHV